MIVGKCIDFDLQFLASFHSNADASHAELLELFFCFHTLQLACSFVQDQVSASSCEAEPHTYSAAVKDIEHVLILLRDGFPDDAPVPTMLVDSEPAVGIFQGPYHSSITKHIDLTLALCRDYVMRGRVLLEHCPTFAQIDDMFTKQLVIAFFSCRYPARFMGSLPYVCC